MARRECGAPLRKKPGQFCRSTLVMPNGRCRIHGGASPNGVASPHFKNGLYSKYMPKDLRNKYEVVRRDQELTKLHEELALQISFITAALQKMSETAPPPWGKAVELLNDCKVAKKRKDQGKFDEAFAAMEQVMRTGLGAAVAYERQESKVRELIQEKTNTAKAEWSRLADLQGLVPLPSIMALWRASMEADRATVMDPAFHDLTPVEQLRMLTMAKLRFMPQPSQEAKALPQREGL